MKKHFYLHTSNLTYLRHLRDDIGFQPIPEYDAVTYQKCHQNEFGRIKTQQNYYHILFGQMKQENCPWCGSIVFLRKTLEGSKTQHSQYCMICINCLARGPVLNVVQSTESNPIAMQEVTNLIKQRYETRRQWDSNLVTPYDDYEFK